jgi:HNH endonuclease/AP2 domain
MGRKSIVLDKSERDHIRATYGCEPETGMVSFLPTEKTSLKAGKITGLSIEKSGYRVMFVTFPSGKRRGLKVHLVAWLLYYGVWPDHFVDHDNRKKDDNRRDNLRRATDSQNRANITKYKTYGGKPCSSQYKGVAWIKDKEMWQAHIRVDGKLLKFGYFKLEDEIEAAKAYDAAAKAYFSSYAVLNFPSTDASTQQPSGKEASVL